MAQSLVAENSFRPEMGSKIGLERAAFLGSVAKLDAVQFDPAKLEISNSPAESLRCDRSAKQWEFSNLVSQWIH